MAKFKFRVSTGFVGAAREEIVEISDDEFEGFTESERNELIQETFNEWMWDRIDAGWEEVEE